MKGLSMRDALIGGGVGLFLGILIGGSFGNVWHYAVMVDGPPFVGFGAPMFRPVLWLGFWVLLIVAVLKGLGWLGRGRVYHGRLEDLPADFDDWHRRAHERMREAAAADDPGRRG